MEVDPRGARRVGITYVDFNTGHYEGDTYLDILEPYIRRIKKEVGILVGVQTPPHPDLKRYDALREMGVNRVSFCFEIFDPCVFKEVCPGKDRQYGLAALPRRGRVLRLARRRRGRATSPGSRTARSSSASSRRSPRSRPSTGSPRWARSRPSASSARSPAPTTPTCRRRRPSRSSRSSAASTRPAWRRACRSASPRTSTSASCCCPTSAARSPSGSFPLQTLKLKLMGQAAKLMVDRNIRTAEARARAGAAA